MSNWIRKAKSEMAKKNITQKDVAPIMGKSTRGAVGHYFTGRSKPTLDQLEDLAKYLGVSLSWLVSDNGSNAAVDDQTLELCIELVSEAEETAGVNLSALATARMAAYLYRTAKEGNEINTKSATELMKLVT